MFEATAFVVTDTGLDVKSLGDKWQRAVARIASAVQMRELNSFANSVKALGALLSTVSPKRADDINELPDDMAAPDEEIPDAGDDADEEDDVEPVEPKAQPAGEAT